MRGGRGRKMKKMVGPRRGDTPCCEKVFVSIDVCGLRPGNGMLE